ncbi:MAG TPA: hypothetical protein VHR44_01535 [Beijerinckiaceae bacterium]|nr:hypothetical protein [Beijerinckiaceae bacterium]
MPQFQPTIFPDFRFPLSGNVDQTINPWTWFFRGISQFGLININLGSSADPDLEQQILDDVGSYGRQIGQISDALYVLFAHKSLDKFDPDERKAIAAFQRQVESVNALKGQTRAATGTGAARLSNAVPALDRFASYSARHPITSRRCSRSHPVYRNGCRCRSGRRSCGRKLRWQRPNYYRSVGSSSWEREDRSSNCSEPPPNRPSPRPEWHRACIAVHWRPQRPELSNQKGQGANTTFRGGGIEMGTRASRTLPFPLLPCYPFSPPGALRRPEDVIRGKLRH